MPDPSANPYLALSVMLAAGLDGIATKADHREPVDTNIFELSHREKRRLRIDDLPHDLNEACDELEKDEVIIAALGEHVSRHFINAKRAEWREYITQVEDKHGYVKCRNGRESRGSGGSRELEHTCFVLTANLLE